MIVYFCTNWGFYTLLTCIPILLKQTLGCSNNIPIVLNGIYSSIPYVFLSLSTLLSGPLADYVRSHWFSTGVTRKLFDIVGESVIKINCGEGGLPGAIKCSGGKYFKVKKVCHKQHAVY
jgi:hypothetical protein